MRRFGLSQLEQDFLALYASRNQISVMDAIARVVQRGIYAIAADSNTLQFAMHDLVEPVDEGEEE